MRNDPYKIVTDVILKRLEQGDIPWKKPWRADTELPRNMFNHNPYSGINIWLLLAQGYDNPYWASYKQISEKGGFIKKGEKATPVVFWKKYQKLEENSDGEEVEKTFFTLRYWPVFNYSQTTGLKFADIKEIEPQPMLDPTLTIERAKNVISGFKDKPLIEHGKGLACYFSEKDLVFMPSKESFFSIEEYYATLFHELSHSTGHVSRLGRKLGSKKSSMDYAFEELIAEFSASYLCGISNIMTSKSIDNHAAYIKSWHKRLSENPKYIVQACSKGMKSANYILGIKEKDYE